MLNGCGNTDCSEASEVRRQGTSLRNNITWNCVREKFLDMDKHVRDKKEELATVENKLQKVKQDYEPYKAQEELNLIHSLFR